MHLPVAHQQAADSCTLVPCRTLVVSSSWSWTVHAAGWWRLRLRLRAYSGSWRGVLSLMWWRSCGGRWPRCRWVGVGVKGFVVHWRWGASAAGAREGGVVAVKQFASGATAAMRCGPPAWCTATHCRLKQAEAPHIWPSLIRY